MQYTAAFHLGFTVCQSARLGVYGIQRVKSSVKEGNYVEIWIYAVLIYFSLLSNSVSARKGLIRHK